MVSSQANPRSRGASHIDFKSATTGVAAKAMRNELNNMVAEIQDSGARKVSWRQRDEDHGRSL